MSRAIRFLMFGLLFLPASSVRRLPEPKSLPRLTQEATLTIGLLLDNSGSVRNSFSQVINLGKEIVHNADTVDQLFVVRFVSADKIQISCDFTSNQSALNKALEEMYIEGGVSAITDAVYRAAEHFPNDDGKQSDQSRRQAIVLITDGAEESSYHRTDQLITLLRQKHLRVYAVGFPQALASQGRNVQERARKYLTTLATESGGRVYFPTTTADLKSVANSILIDIRDGA